MKKIFNEALVYSALFSLVSTFSLLAEAHGSEDDVPTPILDRETATLRLKGAALEGWTKIAAEAIRYGANVDETNEYGTGPLLVASIRGYEKIVKLLLDAGANPNLENDDHVTPLLAAATNCNDPVVSLLLARGANPNVKNLTRQTPLMRASENGCAVVVKVLLKSKQLDLRGVDDSGRTALDYAKEAAVLGLDYGDSYAILDGRRRDALRSTLKNVSAPGSPRFGLPRGTSRTLELPAMTGLRPFR